MFIIEKENFVAKIFVGIKELEINKSLEFMP